MLSAEHRGHYGERLRELIATYRRDLDAPDLPWFVAEISDKGIWGMDHRSPMRIVRAQQREVVAGDEHVHWIPTSHLAFEVMKSGQPHYHFGTQGQLQQGEAYAAAYLQATGAEQERTLGRFDSGLPVTAGETARVYLLLGGRSVEGEDAWVSELSGKDKRLSCDQPDQLPTTSPISSIQNPKYL